MFFIICTIDNPSGSAPFTIASTMSGARLFKPRTRVTYGGFKPSEALGTHCNRNVVPDAFCRFRAALCSDPAWDHIFFAFPECVSSASSQSGSQSGGITDNFTVTVLDTFDKICIFVQSSPCNMEFVVYITL